MTPTVEIKKNAQWLIKSLLTPKTIQKITCQNVSTLMTTGKAIYVAHKAEEYNIDVLVLGISEI